MSDSPVQADAHGVRSLFSACWDSFCAGAATNPITAAQVAQWAGGRGHYAVWLAPITSPDVARRMATLQPGLRPWLRQDYLRYPHITLAGCGFPGDPAGEDDEFTADRLDEQLAALASRPVAPFSVCVEGANSFAATPFLEVADPSGGLMALHLLLDAWHPTGPRTYLPHVTLGHYADRIETAQVAEALLPLRALPRIEIEVARVTLATYETSAICGQLSEVCSVDLKTGQLHWAAQAVVAQIPRACH